MRALAGSIITAGALIGLGLTALGYGIRFQGQMQINEKTGHYFGMPSMTLMLVVLILCAGIGLGIAFLGLAYHHERRHRERLPHETVGSARTGL